MNLHLAGLKVCLMLYRFGYRQTVTDKKNKINFVKNLNWKEIELNLTYWIRMDLAYLNGNKFFSFKFLNSTINI